MRNQRKRAKSAGSADAFYPDHPQRRTHRGSNKTNQANAGSRPSITSSRSQQRRMHRLLTGGNTRSQKTLTQIKFVDCPPVDEEDDDDDLDLQYIGEPFPSGPRTKNTRGRGQIRKSRGTRTGVMDSTNNDTLTQMDWIRSTAGTASSAAGRRSLRGAGRGAARGERQPSPIPEREPQHRGGARKRRVSEMDTIQEESEPEDTDEGAGRSKRIKTSHGAAGKRNPPENSGASKACDTRSDQKPASLGNIDDAAVQLGSAVNNFGVSRPPNPIIPMTPHKQRERVIPSSQSPESPEVTFLGQNELPASPSRTPLKTISHNKLSGADSWRGQDAMPSQGSKPKGLSLPLQEEYKPNIVSAEKTQAPERQDVAMARDDDHNDMKNGRLGSQKKQVEVVNDTDDESDAEDDGFSDAFSQLSDAEIPRSQLPQKQGHHHPSPDKSSSPNPDLSGQPEDGPVDNAPQSTAGSDMSILYCRRPMSSHFGPTGHDVPDLSSGGLAELFTTQGLGGRNADQTSNNENADHVKTELIRESSPIQTDEIYRPDADDNDSGPPSSPVVLVESSQRDDQRANNEMDGDSDNDSNRGLLTASQLLTESLMESIPVPPGWRSSQNYDTMQEEVVTQSCDGN